MVENYWKPSELTRNIDLNLRNLSFELMLLNNIKKEEDDA